MFIAWLMYAVFWTVLLGGGGYLILRFIRAYERKAVQSTEMAKLEERVQLLEEANSRLESEIAAIDEAHQFTMRLLTERAAAE